MMRIVILVISLLPLATVTAASDLGPGRPAKPFHFVTPPPADPTVLRQGGDNIDDAIVIDALPFNDTGTTVGYNEDYDQSCPYGLYPTPDVCYLFTPDHDMLLTVDLCGSLYDTKTFIFGPNWEEIACNDDYYSGPPCGVYVSLIEAAPLDAGLTYLICIDGYAGSTGDYVLEISEYVPCELEIPAGAVLEGEPPLVDGYWDSFNGGCNSPGAGYPFQDLIGDPQGELLFAGVSGWYNVGYNTYRDTDWFTAVFGPTGLLEITLTAEIRTNFFELGPQNCDEVAVVNQWSQDDCESVPAQVTGDPGSVVWLWVGPQTYQAPDGWLHDEYDYLLEISGLAPGTVAVEASTWSRVKALYR